MYFKEISSTEKGIEEDLTYKFIVIGNSGVGKSNFILKILGKDFQTESQTTIGVELFSKYFKVGITEKGKEIEKIIKINIWDTAGQERYKSVTSSYYKGAKGVFVLYDLTKSETFESVDYWIKDAKLYCQHKPNIMIIGTKSDLTHLLIIDELKQKAKADFYSNIFYKDSTYMEISSKDETNVDVAFITMIKEIFTKTELESEVNNKESKLFQKKNNPSTCCG